MLRARTLTVVDPGAPGVVDSGAEVEVEVEVEVEMEMAPALDGRARGVATRRGGG